MVMLAAVISVGSRTAPRRLTLSVWAAIVSMSVLISGLVMQGLSSWYDLEDFHAVTAPSQDSYTADDNGAGGLALWLISAAGLLVIGILIVTLAILVIAMVKGSRVASRIACGLAAAFALSCGALSLFGSNDTQAAGQDPNSYVVTVAHNPGTTPRWASWSNTAALPVFTGGAVLTTVVLLLPSTRRDLHARRRPQS